MSDETRRRRKNSDSEDESEVEEDNRTLTPEPGEKVELADTAPKLQEEDTVKDDEEAVAEEEVPAEEEAPEGLEDLGDEGVKEDHIATTEEEEARGHGDGQADEEGPVDDDLDRRNPQYIPKKGMFYEHDDRIDSEDEEAVKAAEEEEAKRKKKPAKSDTMDRWGHDKFAEMEQEPKSKEELVNTYGYDIRGEDNAPRARRRRRYGRGPNKYTRNWEDEEAYAQTGRPKRELGRTGPRKSEEDLLIRAEAPAEEIEAVLQSPPTGRHVRGSGRGGRGRGAPNRGGRGGRGGPPRTNGGHEMAKPRPAREGHDRDVDVAEKRLARTRLDDRASLPDSRRGGHEAKSAGQPKRYSTTRQPKNGSQNSSEIRDGLAVETEKGRPATVQPVCPSGDYREQPPYPVLEAHFNPVPYASPVPNGPFINQPRHGTPPAVTRGMAMPNTGPPTASYINPNGLMNYGPPPVQFTPVTVPISVPLVGVPADHFVNATLPMGVAPVPAGTPIIAAQHLGVNVVSSPEQVLMAAGMGVVTASAAPPPGTQGYAEVRGGVTYFNPTVQPVLITPRAASKRPKAAIPIVDPSEIEDDGGEDAPDSVPMTNGTSPTEGSASPSEITT